MSGTNTTTAPDDEPTPEEIAAAGTIRPLEDIPSPWTVKGNPRILSQPTLSILSAEDQQIVRERAGGTDEESIQNALMGFLRERQREFRIQCGGGEGTTETEVEALNQMHQLRELTEEYHRIKAELDDIIEHRTEYQDGEPVPVPVYRHNGAARIAREHRMDEIGEAMAHVAGAEGEAALKRAARSDALRNRDLRQQADDAAEARRRAAAREREERIEKLAAGNSSGLRVKPSSL